jgi:hypothetical protein
VILAHHAGEDIVLMLAASGAGAVSVLTTVLRTRVTRFADRIGKMVNVLWRRA